MEQFGSLGFRTGKPLSNSIANFTINEAGVRFRLSMPGAAAEVFWQNYGCYLAELKALKARQLSDVRLEARAGPGKSMLKGNSIQIRGIRGDTWLGLDSLLYVSKRAEAELNRQGTFSIHASGISFGRNAALLTGSSWAGKTSVAIYASLVHGASLVTGNRVFMKGKVVIGGSKILRPRANFLNMPIVKRHIPKPGRFAGMKSGSKITVDPKELGITNILTGKANAAAIFNVRLTDSRLVVESTEARGDEHVGVFDDLYKALSEFSDSFPSIVYGSGTPYPDISGERLRQRRAEYASFILENIPILSIHGRLADISKFISEYMQRLSGA